MSLFSKLLHRYRYYRTMAQFKQLDTESVFTKIYRENFWGGDGGEFNSGPGTTNANARQYIDMLAGFIRTNQVKSVLDIGCGDFRIMNEVLKQVEVDYTGTDIVKDLIDNHTREHGNNRTRFVHLNAIEDKLPPAELVVIRQVLQHLSNAQITAILSKLKGYRFLIITEHLPAGTNVVVNADKQPGPNIRLYRNSGVFIDQPPFSLKVSRILLEYREDSDVFGQMAPAVIRTSLVEQ